MAEYHQKKVHYTKSRIRKKGYFY